jgi:hypothetical protein
MGLTMSVSYRDELASRHTVGTSPPAALVKRHVTNQSKEMEEMVSRGRGRLRRRRTHSPTWRTTIVGIQSLNVQFAWTQNSNVI